jgi:ankyrin repeat protein
MLAAQRRYIDTVIALLAVPNIQVNQVDSDGNTALTTPSIIHGPMAIIQALVTAGATLDAKTQAQLDRWLLNAAGTRGIATATVLELIAAGANINAAEEWGSTALMLSANLNNTALVTALLSIPGIQVNQADSNGRTALKNAVDHNYIATVNALIAAGATVNAQTQAYLDRELLQSARRGNTTILLALITAGANVNTASHNDMSPLMWAAESGHFDIVKALLATPGILVNQVTSIGGTALMIANRNGHIEIVNALITAGANLHAETQDGATALIRATANNFPDVVTALVSAGAHPLNTVRPYEGNLALIIAAQIGNMDAVNQLLAIQAVRDQINWTPAYNPQQTAISDAFEHDHHNIVAILQRHGAVLPERLRQAANRINGAQSVHEVSVHVSVSNSATNLREHYKYTEEELNEQITELTTWLSADFSDTSALPCEYKSEWLIPARACVARLKALDFIDQRSGVTMQEALAFSWAGINNDQAMGADSPALSREEITSRRINFLKNLYEIQRTNNLEDGATPQDNGGEDDASCVPGAFNNLLAALSEVGHVGVQVVFITKNIVNLQALTLSKQAFSNFPEEQRKRFAKEWESENSEAIQAECFGLLKEMVGNKLHEKYDDFRAEVPNLDEIIIAAIDAIQYMDLSAELENEKQAIQKKEQEALAKRARQATEVVLSTAVWPAVHQQQREAVVFSCNTRGVKRPRAEAVNEPEEANTVAPAGRYPKRNTRSFRGSYRE